MRLFLTNKIFRYNSRYDKQWYLVQEENNHRNWSKRAEWRKPHEYEVIHGIEGRKYRYIT